MSIPNLTSPLWSELTDAYSTTRPEKKSFAQGVNSGLSAAPTKSISLDFSDSDSDSEYEDEIMDITPIPSQKLKPAPSPASLEGLKDEDRPTIPVGGQSVLTLSTMPSISNIHSVPKSSSLTLFGIDTTADTKEEEEDGRPEGLRWEHVEECYEEAKRRLPHLWNP